MFQPNHQIPSACRCGDFANIDLRIKIGRKMLAVVTTIAIQNVQRAHLFNIVFGDIGGENIGHAGVKPATQKRHDAALDEAVVIGPLPVIFKLGLIARLIIRRIQIIDTRRKAGIHYGKVLIGSARFTTRSV